MSRQIDLDQPLSKADRKYLEDRNRLSDIRRNDERFGAPEPESSGEPDMGAQGKPKNPDDMTEEELVAWAESLTVKEIRTKITERGGDLPDEKAKKDIQVNALLDTFDEPTQS